MKNLKMFAISLAAFAAMTMGVHATSDGCEMPDSAGNVTAGKTKCVATRGDYGYSSFGAAWTASREDGGKIKLLEATTVPYVSSGMIEGEVEINLNGYDLTIIASSLTVESGASLKITGAGTFTTNTLKVNAGGTLEIDKDVKLAADSEKDLIETAGIVKINGGAELKVNNHDAIHAVIKITAPTANVTLNAKVGTKSFTAWANLIDIAASAAPTQIGGSKATVTVEGGEYYMSDNVFKITQPINLVVNGGTFVSGKTTTVVVTKGNVVLNNGTFETKTTDNRAVIYTDGHDEGSLEINGGTYTSKAGYAVYLLSDKIVTKITNGTFNSAKQGGKQLPAIFINSALLTGLNDEPEADIFKGILTGGRYLSAIIGDRANGAATQSAATVQNYVVAEGATVTEDGNYKVINAKVEDQQEPQDPTVGDGDANDQNTTENVPNVPKTSDNILVYASLGLISAVSVGFTAKRKENN